jgi:hypothetical protein
MVKNRFFCNISKTQDVEGQRRLSCKGVASTFIAMYVDVRLLLYKQLNQDHSLSFGFHIFNKHLQVEQMNKKKTFFIYCQNSWTWIISQY